MNDAAIAMFKAKDFAGAVRLFEMLPQVPIIRYNTAMCYRDMGGLDNLHKAMDILAKLVRSKVKDGTLYNQIREAYVSLMTMVVRHYAVDFKLEEAMRINQESMKIIPNHPILLYNQGHLHKCLGQHETALQFLKRSLIYNPQYFDAYIEQINIWNDARDYAKAEQTIREGLEAIPGDSRFYNELGVCLCRLGRVKEGFDAYEMGLSLPNCTPVIAGKIYTNVGNAYSFLGDVPASLENSRRGYQSDPTNTTAMQNYLMNLLYVFQDQTPYSDVLKQHLEVGAMFAKQMAIKEYTVAPYEGPRDPASKIRIGYVSGDFFGEHPMTYFLKALLTCFDTSRFEVYGYSNQKLGTVPAYSPEIKWRDIKYLDTKNVAHMITKEDKIDVLIDLSGHTACNRMDVFSNRCARVQLSYLGYPCITGVPNVDHYIIDKTFNMRIKTVEMPHCFTHYWPANIPDPASLVSPFHADSDGFFHLGTLNKLAKVNQVMVDMWDSILDAFPKAKLLIRRNYVFKFRNSDRVVMLEHEPTYQGHLQRYNQIDIALDTAPYSGTTTTCESLVMGTPVITLADRKRRAIHQNVSASLLINSGMGHLVVDSLDGYIRVIRSLMDEIAADPDHKRRVQAQFLGGNVCDRDQYMRDFEELIVSLHAKAT